MNTYCKTQPQWFSILAGSAARTEEASEAGFADDMDAE